MPLDANFLPAALKPPVKSAEATGEGRSLSAASMQSAITRMMVDRDFRHLAQTKPRDALRDYELSEDELEALARRDLFKLEELGLEPWTARWVTSLR